MMDIMYQWNPVYNIVMDIKHSASHYVEDIYNYDDYDNIIAAWIDILLKNGAEDAQEYKDIFSFLLVNQWGDYVLIRYASLIDTFKVPNFWEYKDCFYRECRSVVIDVREETIVLAPYRKFFNINEKEETNVDVVAEKIESAQVVEFAIKEDGSMQCARWYNGRVVLAGSQAINPNNSWRVQEGYRMIMEDANYKRMLRENDRITFIFEFIHPDDIHVTRYTAEQSGLYLIGMRNVYGGYEYNYSEVIEVAEQYGVHHANLMITTLPHMLETLDDVPAAQCEGVVINVDGQRYKLKYSQHCDIARIKGSILSPKSTFEAIKNGTYDDVVAQLPQTYVDIIENYAEQIFTQVDEYKTEVAKYLQIFSALGMTGRKQTMIWITTNVPSKLQNAVRMAWLGNEVDYLKLVDLSIIK
jgi:hypothetical protein